MILSGPAAASFLLQGQNMEQIPWSDEAVAVQQVESGHPGERVIVAQGTLGSVIDELADKTRELDPSLIISLSDRRVPPFHLDLRETALLIRKRWRYLSEGKRRGRS
jgi:hypothetical protein